MVLGGNRVAEPTVGGLWDEPKALPPLYRQKAVGSEG